MDKFESHITIEPVLDAERQAVFDAVCKPYRFRAAKLWLQKDRAGTLERSDKDAFCTGHGTEYTEMAERTAQLVQDLTQAGFDVWSYKIEQIVLDVRLV